MMSHFAFHGIACGVVLVLAAALAPPAKAQDPHTQSRTGRIRELQCRGKPGIDLRIERESSARQPSLVAMVLRYERLKETRSVGQQGMVTVDHGRSVEFQPGGCTWNPGGFADIPPEPGVVYFDLQRDAQTWAAPGARDTTINAAAHFPDVASLTRYLSDPDRYWIFYVDDVTNVSISFGSWHRDGSRPPLTFGGALRDASPTLSSAHVMTGDSAARRPTVVQAPTPAGRVDGPLRDKAPATSMRTPAPTAGVAGPLRPGSAGTATVSTERAQPAGSATRQPDAGTASGTRLAERRLSNVRTAPGPLGVTMTFDATGLPLLNPQNSIRVEIEFEPPAWNARERRWSYPTGWGGHWFAKVTAVGTGRYEAQPWSALEASRRYHYLITVFGTDGLPEAQRTGSFTADIRK